MVVPKKLLDREANFIFDVLERSSEMSAKLTVHSGKKGDAVDP